MLARVSSRRQAQAEQAIIIAAAMLIPMSCRMVVIISQNIALGSQCCDLYHPPTDVSSLRRYRVPLLSVTVR